MKHTIPTMTGSGTHDYLRQLGSEWTGQGVAMELGSWLGSSAVSLLEGLKTAGYDRWFWSFDKYRANDQQVQKAKKQGVTLFEEQNLQPLFVENIGRVYGKVKSIRGNLPGSLVEYSGDPIEICIFDAPKQEPVFSGSIQALHKFWIPGVTVLGLLDYNFYKAHTDEVKRERFMAPVKFMEQYGECFTLMRNWPNVSAVFFRYVKPLKL